MARASRGRWTARGAAVVSAALAASVLALPSAAFAHEGHADSAPATGVATLTTGEVKQVLFYGPTSGGLAAQTPDIEPTVWDEETWSGKTTAEFAAFDAIVFGDQPACFGYGDTETVQRIWGTAIANREIWSRAVTGNVTVNGTDPDFHHKPEFVMNSVRFAAEGSGTGLYVSLSCAYHDDITEGQPVELLGGIGDFRALSVGDELCPSAAHIVATHPSLDALTDEYMSNWGCSAHEGFTAWPGNFSPLVITTDASSSPFTASDGTSGLVYVLASGARTSGLSMVPKDATGNTGTEHVVVGRLVDPDGEPVAGESVSFTVESGPNTGVVGTCLVEGCVTDVNGQAAWSYVGGPDVGDDTIRGWLDQDGSGAPNLGEPQTTALMVWEAGSGAYVALGDSFSAGDGTPPYAAGTNVAGTNTCRRSDLAYPQLLAGTGPAPTQLDVVACSGATFGDLTAADADNAGQPAQLDAVGTDTTLVTMTMGATEVGFADVLRTCVADGVRSCRGAFDAQVSDALSSLGSRRGPYAQAVRDIKAKASPEARILVLGYPTLFDPEVKGRACPLSSADQAWMNERIADLNDAVRRNVRAAGGEYVDVQAAFAGHHACAAEPAVGSGFLPNALGHELLAGALRTALGIGVGGSLHDVLPGATTELTRAVGEGVGSVTFASSWPGSDVVMTLVSPSGREITRGDESDDVVHHLSSTDEAFTVLGPEAGTWTVRLFGADVAFEGEPTRLRVLEEPAADAPPVAVGTVTPERARTGQTVTFDASGSTDDGELTGWSWDFGDGSPEAAGETVTHTYAEAGTYAPLLTVVDDAGQSGHGHTAEVVVTAGPAPSPSPSPPTPSPSPPAPSPSPSPTPTPVTFSTGDHATASDPLVVRIVSPNGGPVTAVATDVESLVAPTTDPVRFGRAMDITAPAATAADPIEIVFRLHSSLVDGAPSNELVVLRNGTRVAGCATDARKAEPDPCLARVQVTGEETVLTVYTSRASTWTFGRTVTPVEPTDPCAGVSGQPFTDVPADNRHRATIACAAFLEIARGVDATTYAPTGDVTRGQMASFVARMLTASGYALPDAPTSAFTDLDSGIHAPAVRRLAAVGVVKGVTDSTFAPEVLVTRGQVASLLQRAHDLAADAPLPAGDDAFDDNDGNVHEAAIDAVAAARIALGSGERAFAPDRTVRRDQMASFLIRTLRRLV